MFQKATKKGARLRCAIFGPSGSGKTYSALRIATGIRGIRLAAKIALIDTERRSACKYADRFDFNVCELNDRTLDGYTQVIHAARDYDVLIIDSLSHGWQELLQEIDRLAKGKYRGNTWAAWSDGTPRQRAFIDTLLASPCHIIATIRSKTEWQTANKDGKVEPVRVGLAPEQGKGIEYEFDLLLELSPEHVAQVIKDRTGKFQDALIDKPDERFGADLAAWLADGEPAGHYHTSTAGADAAPAVTSEIPPTSY